MRVAECYPEAILSDYQTGALRGELFDAVTEHIRCCSTCLDRLQQLETGDNGLLRSLRHQKGQRVATADPLLTRAVARVLGQATSAPDPAAAVDIAAAGAVLNEYRLVEKLGAGGMGAVFRALHTRLDKDVALKVIQPRWSRDRHMVERFQREMKAIGKLRHANIVTATDAGEARGMLYLVMELERGADLADYVQRRGPLAPAEACDYARQAALGLHAAHTAGLVHRDVKPSNLLRTEEGQIKLVDLGLARLQDEEAPTNQTDIPTVIESASATSFGFSGTHGRLGTDDYMAPEQWEDAHEVDARADLYGLGCTLFFLLTGAPPFPAAEHPTRAAKRHAHVAKAPPSLRRLRPDVSRNVEVCVHRLLAKQPQERYASAQEAAAALAACARPRQWRRGPILAACAALIGVTAVAILLPDRRRGDDHTSNSAPVEPNEAVRPTDQKNPQAPKATAKAARVEAQPAGFPLEAKAARAVQQQWADQLDREIVVVNSIGMKLALIPPGRFPLNTSSAAIFQHPFEIGVTEVTRGQFAAFVNDSQYRTDCETSGRGGFFYPGPRTNIARQAPNFVWQTPGQVGVTDDHPVVHVTWRDAQAFCDWLSRREKRVYRLPTVAEWQWACRAGADTRFYHGDDPKPLDKFAWFDENAGGRAQAVGKKEPNAWGLFDMLGNVAEWCHDGSGAWPLGESIDPVVSAPLITRMVAGGHYLSSSSNELNKSRTDCKTSGATLVDEGNSLTGFRVVRVRGER